MAVRVITPPADYPLTLAEVKAHLRVDHTDEDAMITAYLAGATDHAQKFMGRALITQTLELVLDKFYPQIQIPMPPLQSIVSVKYDDADGAEQTLVENTDYIVDTASQPGWVVPVDETWPTPILSINTVRIRYIAGYAETGSSPPVETVPFDIKAAILLMVGSLYAHRETIAVGVSVAAMPWSAEQLMRQHRVELALA
jgi:uncharacterized phiE125 gp8 family phage protein